MNNKIKLLATKSLCGILAASSFLTIPSTCFAATNTEKVNSLLQDIYSENPELKNYEENIKAEINYRLRIARERKYSDKVCSNYTMLDNASNKEDVFEKIYDSNFWGSDESKSGPGSQIESTESVRESLPKLFEKYNIKSVLDAPCGDYNWMKTVEKNGIKYIGGDIVPKIVRANNKNYKDENTSFKVIDITSDEIPQVDLIICRDCLQHLSQKNAKKALKNFKESGSKYLLVTNYPWTLENYDIKNGDFCPLNLCETPFGLPLNPTEKIKESHAEGRNCSDKYLYLYKLDDINIDKMFAKQKATHNVPIAMALDENYVYPTVVSITSAMENSNYKANYDFYIMHTPNLSEESKKILKSLQDKYDNCSINLIDMQDKFSSAYTDSRITTSSYYRLMLSDLFPNLDKIIWIDGDTLILKDLTEMINIDMDGYCYKGFLDTINGRIHLKNSFNIDDDHFICDGVMLVNLKELRKENSVEKFNDFISKNNDKLEQHDQTVINVVFHDKIGVLPAKFGVFNQNENWLSSFSETLMSPEKYTVQELLNARRSPAILHCTHKPWFSPNAALAADKWWQYAEKTDIFDKIKQKYLISDGVYTIASALNPDKVLDIDNASNEQGAKLQLWDKNNTSAQKFKVTYDKNGYYIIEAVCSGNLIDIPYASNELGTQLWQYSNNDSVAQKWYILPNNDGSYRIISKCNGMSIDVKGAETSNGTEIQCYQSNGTSAQNFIFTKSN